MSDHLPTVHVRKLDNGVTVLTIETPGLEVEARLDENQTDNLIRGLL